MKLENKTMLVYAVTDRTWLNGSTLKQQVEQAIKGGATLIQLREKELSYTAFLEQAIQLKKVTDKYHIPLIINDNVDVAKAVNAEGVHVGQKDMEAGAVRQKLGENKIIGVSVQTVEQALLAQKQGADYLGVGAVFGTNTKSDAKAISKDILKEIANSVNIPVVAIGGITADKVSELKGCGIAGVAVVSAILKAQDIDSTTKDFVCKLKQIV